METGHRNGDFELEIIQVLWCALRTEESHFAAPAGDPFSIRSVGLTEDTATDAAYIMVVWLDRAEPGPLTHTYLHQIDPLAGKTPNDIAQDIMGAVSAQARDAA